IFCFGHRRRPGRRAGLLSAPSLAISLTLPCLSEGVHLYTMNCSPPTERRTDLSSLGMRPVAGGNVPLEDRQPAATDSVDKRRGARKPPRICTWPSRSCARLRGQSGERLLGGQLFCN